MVGIHCGMSGYVLHTGSKHFIGQRSIKNHIHLCITVSGIEGVTVYHIQFFTLILPAFHFGIYYGTYRTVGKNPLATDVNGLNHGSLRAVPSPERSGSATIVHLDDVIPESPLQLLIGRIKLAFLDFQSLAEFAIKVCGLLFVEINAVCYQLAFESDAMMLLNGIRISVSIGINGIPFGILVFLGSTEQHFGKNTCGIYLIALFRRKRDGQCLFALCRHVDDKCQLVGTGIAIHIVQLGGYFRSSVGYNC